MEALAVEVHDLHKRYGKSVAVDGVSFTVRQGEIFGLLGPNGAGKTTTLECLEGLRRPDRGTLRVLGMDPSRHHRELQGTIGVQLQAGALPGYLCIDEALRLFSAYRGMVPDFKLLNRFGLGHKLRAQYNTLSTGEKRRLELALAVVHRPRILFLDEPTARLDVGTRIGLHGVMHELQASGTTIILSTHDMAEAETMADRVAILLQGRVVAVGTPKELTATGSGLSKISVRSSADSLADESFPGVVNCAKLGDYVIYFTSTPAATVSAVMRHIERAGDQLIDLRVERPSLEERFLELTQTETTFA